MRSAIFASILFVLGRVASLATPIQPATDITSIDDGELSKTYFSDEDIEQLRLQYGVETNITEDGNTLAKRSLTLTYTTYLVTINGNNVGNEENFVVQGYLYKFSPIASIGTTNGNNPQDFMLRTGGMNPIANPQRGVINWVTNRYLYAFLGGNLGISKLDYAYVKQNKRTYTVQVDSRLSAANGLSLFNTHDGLFAQVYIVLSGGMTISFSVNGKTCWGSINIVGKGLNNIYTHPYRGYITGSFRQSGKITF